MVGIEIESLLSKSNKENGVAPPPHSNWSLMEPSRGPKPRRLVEAVAIELLVALKTRKLLILRNGKGEKNRKYA